MPESFEIIETVGMDAKSSQAQRRFKVFSLLLYCLSYHCHYLYCCDYDADYERVYSCDHH